MSREEEFEEFWKDQLESYHIDIIKNITEADIEFMRGYFNAVKDLPAILINAKQMAHDESYPILNSFIEEISKIMYDETKEGMEANLENYATGIIENYID